MSLYYNGTVNSKFEAWRISWDFYSFQTKQISVLAKESGRFPRQRLLDPPFGPPLSCRFSTRILNVRHVAAAHGPLACPSV